MKQIVLILMSILSFSCSSQTQRQATDTTEPVSKKILVAYFSCTGTTGRVAESIAGAVDGRLYRITPAEAYTSADLDWNDKSSRSSVEMADEDSRPELAGEPLDMKDYDIVFLGYPIWWGIAAWPINTFISANDFSGKTVIPFCTSSSSGIGNSDKLLAEAADSGNWTEGKRFSSRASEGEITDWVHQLNISQ